MPLCHMHHNLEVHSVISFLILVFSYAEMLWTGDAVAVLLGFQHTSSCCTCNEFTLADTQLEM